MSTPAFGRRLGLSILLGATAACAARPTSVVMLNDPVQIRAALDSINVLRIESQLAEAQREGGPRLNIWTEEGLAASNRVRATFRLEDDAYVAVFHVGRDGRILMMYPETPEDPTLLRAGHRYRLPEFFPGLSNVSYGSGFGTRYSSASYFDGSRTARDAGGYVFAIASWSPLRFDRLEDQGLMDVFRSSSFGMSLRPYDVMHEFGDALVPRGRHWYSVDYYLYRDQNSRVSGYGPSRCASYQPGYFGLATGMLMARGISPVMRQMLMADFLSASSSCDPAAFAQLYRIAMLSSYGGWNPRPPIGPQLPVPPPPTGGEGDTVSGGGSKPAPSDPPPRDRDRPKVDDCRHDKCDPPGREPRRGRAETSTSGDSPVELGGRRAGAGARGSGGRGTEARGSSARGGNTRGSDVRGGDARAYRNRGNDAQGGDARARAPRPDWSRASRQPADVGATRRTERASQGQASGSQGQARGSQGQTRGSQGQTRSSQDQWRTSQGEYRSSRGGTSARSDQGRGLPSPEARPSTRDEGSRQPGISRAAESPLSESPRFESPREARTETPSAPAKP